MPTRKNAKARNLQAKALEQLGYQAESGPWRNFYFTGAQELRAGVDKSDDRHDGQSPDTIRAMPADLFFDYLGVRLNGPKAEGKAMTINWNFTDTKEQYVLALENGALNHTANKQVPASGRHRDPEPGGVRRGHPGRQAEARGQDGLR